MKNAKKLSSKIHTVSLIVTRAGDSEITKIKNNRNTSRKAV